MIKRLMAAIVIAGAAPMAAGQNAGRGNAPGENAARRMPMRVIDTPYYSLHTDISDAEARETDLRMTRMFEEYQRRTAGFAGQVKEKLPFFLFRNENDYIAAGGERGSAGVYMQGRDGKRLMAIAGEKTDADTWHVIQHEGFHQFVAASIPYPLPAWANEGLAEYFGEAVWTGDGFVNGLIPPDRLKDVQKEIRIGQFKPFKTLMGMSQKDWNDDLAVTNYDEAWSMIHFLAHADGGRYQAPFLQYMQQVSRGIEPQNAWSNIFGQDVNGFQAKYAASWMALKDNPTRDGYVKAAVLTETSFLARAQLMKQTFKDPETFFKEYHPPEYGVNRDLWLPPELFAEYGHVAPDLGQWSFTAGPLPKLVLVTDDGTTYTGSFTVSNGKVGKVEIAIVTPSTKPAAGR